MADSSASNLKEALRRFVMTTRAFDGTSAMSPDRTTDLPGRTPLLFASPKARTVLAVPMGLPAPPMEVVSGTSRTPWRVGLWGGAAGLYAGLSLLNYWIGLSFGNTWTVRDAELFSQLQGLAAVALVVYFLLYVLLVPLPMGFVTISPYGITVQGWPRLGTLPWAAVRRQGRYLYTFTRHLGLPTRFVMTPSQASRIGIFLPG